MLTLFLPHFRHLVFVCFFGFELVDLHAITFILGEWFLFCLDYVSIYFGFPVYLCCLCVLWIGWSTKMEVVDHCSAFASTNLLHLNLNVVHLANHLPIPLAWIHLARVTVKFRCGPLPTLVRMTSEYDTPTFEEDWTHWYLVFSIFEHSKFTSNKKASRFFFLI